MTVLPARLPGRRPLSNASPPCTSTASPGRTAAWSTSACSAVRPASGNAAAWACDTLAGLAARSAAGTATNSAAVAVESDQSVHLVARLELCYTRGDLSDNAGHFVRRDHRSAADTIAGPCLLPSQLIERNGRGVYRHQDFTGCRDRHRRPSGN